MEQDTVKSSETTNGEESVKVQEPGEVIKPIIPDRTVPELVKRLYGLTVEEWKELDSYDDKNYHVLVDMETNNPHIHDVWEPGYVLKILNTMDSKRPIIVEAQHAIMKHLRDGGICTQDPVVNINGQTMSLEKIYANDGDDGKYGEYIVRMLKFIPGNIMYDMPYVPHTFYNIGKFVGQMHLALKGFHHTFYDTFTTLWSLSKIPHLSKFTFVVKDKEDNRVVSEVIEAFNTKVIPQLDNLQRGIIHGDINEQNLLVKEIEGQTIRKEERISDVCGILDFSDVTDSFIIFDLAICICYMSIECKLIDTLDVGGHVLAGYLSCKDLALADIDVLHTCVAARLTQSLVMGLYTNYMDPSNTYVLTTGKSGWPVLHKYWSVKQEELYKHWWSIIESYK